MRRASEIDIALNARPDGMPLQRWLYGELRAAISIIDRMIEPISALMSTTENASGVMHRCVACRTQADNHA